jgi:mycofactocin precursor
VDRHSTAAPNAHAVEVEPDSSDPDHGTQDSTEALVLEELLIEEISIDGMCGVY